MNEKAIKILTLHVRPVFGVHKSFVVAIYHIVMIQLHQLMINGKKMPIGKACQEAVPAVFLNGRPAFACTVRIIIGTVYCDGML